MELKARLRSFEDAHAVASQLATYQGCLHQVDTYFHCPQGRLKLREQTPGQDQLVWYSRASTADVKPSDYRLVDTDDPAGLKEALTSAWGVRAVVDKSRDLFLFENARVHLDKVCNLGNFIEFEAVLAPEDSDASGRELLERLQNAFSIDPSDLISGSYGEMVEPFSLSS
jgi:adenylate cyclase class IV